MYSTTNKRNLDNSRKKIYNTTHEKKLLFIKILRDEGVVQKGRKKGTKERTQDIAYNIESSAQDRNRKSFHNLNSNLSLSKNKSSKTPSKGLGQQQCCSGSQLISFKCWVSAEIILVLKVSIGHTNFFLLFFIADNKKFDLFFEKIIKK